MRNLRAAALFGLIVSTALFSGCTTAGTYGGPDPAGAVLTATTRLPGGPSPAAAGAVKRERFVEVSTATIAPHNQRLELPLFPGTIIEAVGVRIERAGKGFVWIGQVRDQPLSMVILSVQGEYLVGNVLTERGQNYEIRPVGRGVHVVRELDPRTFVEDDVNSGPSRAELAQPSPLADPCGGTDTGADIDVLVAYTATARTAAGGTAQIEALIYGAVASTNQSYLNSGVTQRMRVVHLREVAYTETGNSCTDVTRMQNTSDGFLDDLLTARDAHGADLVALIVNGALVSTTQINAAGQRTGCSGGTFGVFGEAFNILNPNTTAWEPNGYAVLTASSATSNLTFAHELGHLMGARHERLGDPTNNSPFADNHGFFNSAAACLQRSVMTRIAACTSCARIPFWSNPATTRCGAAFGIALPSANAANNANSLNTSAPMVANFRCSSPGRNDVWMRDTWNDTGVQPDPATASEAMWVSPYIWIRTAQDTGFVNQHAHQNPNLNQPVFAYVKLHNGNGGTATGDLELYWAHSSTGLAFPATWTPIGTVAVSGFAPSSTRIVEFPWTTPASAPSAAGHFCLVARWVSASDPGPSGTTDINTLVRSSNNMVWRNLDPLGTTGDGTSDAVFLVRNLSRFGDKQQPEPEPITLRVAPTAEEANGSFFFYGRGVVTLGEEVTEAWRKGGKKGRGFRELADGRLEITDPDGVVLENILLLREGDVRLTLQRNAGTPKRKFHVEATQLSGRSVVGGVTYELTPP